MTKRQEKNCALVESLRRRHFKGISESFRAWAETQIPTDSNGSTKVSKAVDKWTMLEEMTTCEGWQIDRYYVADFRLTSRTAPRLTRLSIAYEYWFKPSTKDAVLLGKKIGMNVRWQRIPWCLNMVDDTWVEVKRGFTLSNGMMRHSYNYGYGYDHDYYCDWKARLYPRTRVLDEFKRMGICEVMQRFIPSYDMFLKAFLKNSMMETLVKTGAWNIVNAWTNGRAHDVEKHYRSILIANKHGYLEGKDEGIYLDYLDQLEELGKDLRSPKYLCPSDLTAEHDRLTALIQRRKDEEQKKRDMESAMKDKEAFKRYEMEKRKWFSLMLTDGVFFASVLKNANEFVEEGMAMHHCVFSNKYYKKSDSLIFSVRGMDGGHEATIEYSISKGMIIQCRTKCNAVHPCDKQIRSLIADNMDEIKRIARVVA